MIEPDADADGYGDETQDLCPTVAEVQAPPCAAPDKTAPETTITKAPKRKTKSKQATFEFRSSEPDSTFQCSLDGAGFADCISPRILIAGKASTCSRYGKRRGRQQRWLTRERDLEGEAEEAPLGERGGR